jgi:hypothetical protein
MGIGKCFERISPCFLTIIRLNILRFDSKKGGQTFLLSSLEDKNKKGK